MSTKSQMKLLEEWESLLEGLKMTAPHTGPIAYIQALLTEAVREARDTRKRRETLRLASHETNKKLAQVLGRGQGLAMKTRTYLKHRLGVYNEELARYGITPIRRGGARKKAGVVEEESL
jgi:hypothetical protein